MGGVEPVRVAEEQLQLSRLLMQLATASLGPEENSEQDRRGEIERG